MCWGCWYHMSKKCVLCINNPETEEIYSALSCVVCSFKSFCEDMGWDVLNEKERTMYVIKGDVEMGRDRMRYLTEMWTKDKGIKLIG